MHLFKTERGPFECLVQDCMEKSYDPVNWKFHDFVREHMGFGKKWWNCKTCVFSPCIFVLVNGMSKGFCKSG